MHPASLTLRACVAAPFLLLAACNSDSGPSGPAVGTQATLALLETTDLHTNIMGYDYFKLAEDPSLGFERTATLINTARKEFANTFRTYAALSAPPSGRAESLA